MNLKFFLAGLIVFLCSFGAAFADGEPLYGVGISKYAVLETTFDFSPVRVGASTEAGRYTHLKKGVTLFADKQNGEFYKVDLGLNKPFWIEKRYVETQGVIPEKRGATVSGVKIFENRKNYFVKINTPVQTVYRAVQTPVGLEFSLYDAVISDGAKVNKKGALDGLFRTNLDEIKGLNGADGFLKVSYLTGAPIFGYEVKKEDNALIFQIRKPLKINNKKPLRGVKIALDAGHGGDEKGVCAGGFCEKDVNLQITKKLDKILRKKGARVILTRKKDKNTGLYERVEIANEKEADFLISIHQNSLPNPKNWQKRHGAGVYYYNKNAYPLALAVENSLVKATGFRKDGVFNASFALTRSTNPVSILVECGYLIHPDERAKLTDKNFQNLVAQGIADGVEEYLKSLCNEGTSNDGQNKNLAQKQFKLFK